MVTEIIKTLDSHGHEHGHEEWWPAPAKLNLFLHITGRRSDGYHELQTIFQFVDYGDALQFDRRTDGVIHRVTELAQIPENDDLVVRAAKLLQKFTNTHYGVDISIKKRLPTGGGIGGGSSDAATTLHALNLIWKLSLSINELADIGHSLGADVPVFIHGLAAFAEGVGEKLTPIELPEPWFVVIAPGTHVSTQELFAAPELTRDSQPITIRDYFEGRCENVFEKIVRARYPAVDEALNWLSDISQAQAKMTGTGSCVFVPVANEQLAQKISQKVPGKWQGFYAKACNKSPLLSRLR